MSPRTLFTLASTALLVAASSLPAQDNEPAKPAQAPKDGVAIVPQWQMEFENLGKEDREKFAATLFEATRLFNQKRIIETLNAVATVELLFKKHPAAVNLKGACYVELRDFAKARAMFEEALDLQKPYLEGIDDLPPNERRARMRFVSNIIFNLAEMDFVTGDWEACHKRLTELLVDADPANIPMNRLMEFKLLLCKIKLDRVDEARALAEKYDYLDDNPYYYYANSAMAYHDGDAESAERWRASARRVFRKPGTLAPWEDTMIEFGYVKSFYGGDLEEGSGAPELPGVDAAGE